MHKIIIKTISLILIGLSLISCQKSKPADFYTDAQKEAMKVLNGTFKEDLYGIVTTYQFTESYNNEPKEVEVYSFTGSNLSKKLVYGKCKLTYYNGDSYDLYYFLNEKADLISFFSDRVHAEVYDLKIVSATEFRLRGEGASWWDTFVKQ